LAWIACPVTYRAAGLHRNRTMAATSSGLPRSPVIVPWVRWCAGSGRSFGRGVPISKRSPGERSDTRGLDCIRVLRNSKRGIACRVSGEILHSAAGGRFSE